MICSWVFVLAAACTAAPDTDVDAFFKDFSAKRDGIVALDATFTQKTKLPDEELSTKGSLVFIKPRRIIFHTEDPERTTLVDDRSGYEYDPEIKQLQIFDIEDNPQADIFFLGFNSNTETLRKAYDITLFDITDDPRGRHGIKIKPKAQSKEQAYFIEVNLYLRDEDFLPYRIHIRNDEESQVFIEVEAIDKTFRPGPQLTQIFLPQDTKVVQNDRVVETVGAGGKRVPDAMLLPPEPETPKPAGPNGVPILVPHEPGTAPESAAAPKPEATPQPVAASESVAAPAPAAQPKLELKPEPKPAAKPKAKAAPKSQGTGAKAKPAPAKTKSDAAKAKSVPAKTKSDPAKAKSAPTKTKSDSAKAKSAPATTKSDPVKAKSAPAKAKTSGDKPAGSQKTKDTQ